MVADSTEAKPWPADSTEAKSWPAEVVCSAGYRVQDWVGMVLAICLDLWVVTIGKAIGLADLVVY